MRPLQKVRRTQMLLRLSIKHTKMVPNPCIIGRFNFQKAIGLAWRIFVHDVWTESNLTVKIGLKLEVCRLFRTAGNTKPHIFCPGGQKSTANLNERDQEEDLMSSLTGRVFDKYSSRRMTLCTCANELNIKTTGVREFVSIYPNTIN